MRKSTINLIVLVKAMVLLVPINTDNACSSCFSSALALVYSLLPQPGPPSFSAAIDAAAI